jgi:outer membrane protein OmpA-like peptidoglycan-associated protein
MIAEWVAIEHRDFWEFEMRLSLILAAGALLASSSALAQSTIAGEQTADDLVCQLSGECGDQLEATQDKPESRGFKIARKGSAAEVPAPKRSAASTAARTVTAPAKVTVQRNPGIVAQPGRNRTIAAQAPRTAPGRADLRVSFVTGSAELTEAGRREADKFLAALANPVLAAKKFRIEGHTDSIGSRESNLELSRRRAQAVVDYLAAKGADRSRFAVQGYGFDKPMAGLPAGAGANRRVEVVVVK